MVKCARRVRSRASFMVCCPNQRTGAAASSSCSEPTCRVRSDTDSLPNTPCTPSLRAVSSPAAASTREAWSNWRSPGSSGWTTTAARSAMRGPRRPRSRSGRAKLEGFRLTVKVVRGLRPLGCGRTAQKPDREEQLPEHQKKRQRNDDLWPHAAAIRVVPSRHRNLGILRVVDHRDT